MQRVAHFKTAERYSYEQAVELFLLAAASRNLTKGSMDWYKSKLNAFGRYVAVSGTGGEVREIREKDIRAYLVALITRCKAAGNTDYNVQRAC